MTYIRNAFTPQKLPLAGEEQVRNNAGGYVYQLDPWKQLDRFLVLGTAGGTYYVKERQLTLENASIAQQLIREDGVRVVNQCVAISLGGRAPKQSPALFVHALASVRGDTATQQAAYQTLPAIARTASTLFEWLSYRKVLGGKQGSGMRRALQRWYNGKGVDQLAYQMVKYRDREGWTHRDVLRVAHPKPSDMSRAALYGWAVGTDPEELRQEAKLPDMVEAFLLAQTATTPASIVKLIQSHGLPREAVPTELLNHASVWEALLYAGGGMPMTALVRNLGNLSKCGLLVADSEAEKHVYQWLGDEQRLKRARVHPLQMLVARAVYQQGRGLRGKGEWPVARRIVEALEDGFYAAFGAVEPTGKRILFGLDVSGSMSSLISDGVPIMCCEAATALALVSARVENPDSVIVGRFNQGIEVVKHRPDARLGVWLKSTKDINGGGTNCALPMVWAAANHQEIDAFIVLTDSETWAGQIHPAVAIRKYREATGIPATLTVVGMQANKFTIADPMDPGMLDVAGFDTATPNVISGFISGWRVERSLPAPEEVVA